MKIEVIFADITDTFVSYPMGVGSVLFIEAYVEQVDSALGVLAWRLNLKFLRLIRFVFLVTLDVIVWRFYSEFVLRLCDGFKIARN